MCETIRKPARSFQPGDWVRWRQGPVDVTGKVVACVPRGRSGAEVFLKLTNPNAEFVAAPHRSQEVESYLVRVTGTTWGRARVYWPMARSLEASDWVVDVDMGRGEVANQACGKGIAAMTKVVFEITDGMVPHSECFDAPGTEADIERSFVAWVAGFGDHWRKDLATWKRVPQPTAHPPYGDFHP